MAQNINKPRRRKTPHIPVPESATQKKKKKVMVELADIPNQPPQITKSKLDKINLPMIICTHAFGKHHTQAHRMSAGLAVIMVGVVTAHLGGHMVWYFAIPADAIGYLIHGAGCVPFVDYLIEKSNEV